MSFRGDPSASELESFRPSVGSHSPLGNGDPQRVVVFSRPADLAWGNPP